MRLEFALESGCCDENLAEMGEGIAEKGLPDWIERKAEIIDGHERFFSDLLGKAVPLCKSESTCRCLLLAFAGKCAPCFSVDPKREIVAVGACESETEIFFFGAVFSELL